MKPVDFPPPRQRGIPIHITLLVILAFISALGAWLATNQPIGMRFTAYILMAAVAFAPLPVLGYRLWALIRSHYALDRESLTITWGLRVERIPISDVEWVRPLSTLTHPLRLPALRLPGSILGTRRTAEVGSVEFLASESASLLLVATRQNIYAISPSDPQAFLMNIQHATEMGSLSPAQPESIYPGLIVSAAWQDRLIRYFWLAGLFLNLGLLIWVTLMIPSLGTISLGFLPSGKVGEAVPGVGLVLVPVISLFLYGISWLAGLAFYRTPKQQDLARVVWAGSLVASLLFIVAVLFIVITPI